MFNKARLKLTFWYLLILMFISVSFSFVVYRTLSSEIDRFSYLQKARLEERFQKWRSPDFGNPPPIILDEELVEDIKRRLIFFLFLINSGILIFVGSLSYFLAGKTLKPIEEMMERQKQFVSDASHEFKTPLTSLKTSLEVGLRDKQINLKKAKSLLKDNLEEVNRLQSLTENLLALSRYDSVGKIVFSKVNLSLVVDEALRRVKPLLLSKNIKLEKSIKDVEFMAEPESVIELLVILLDNAIKYSQEGKTVKIDSKVEKKFLFLSVTDYGIGIKKKDLPHIFDRFYQADSSRQKGNGGGFGLGLAVAKKIVERHKGEITVKSKWGEGSTFIVKLPIES